MKKPTDIGTNRTGLGASPLDGKALVDGARAVTPSGRGDEQGIVAERSEYIAGGWTVGSMPPPTSLKGVAKTAVHAVLGDQPNVLLDKLGERLAFERTGFRLYQALIGKVRAHAVRSPQETTLAVNGASAVEELEQFRDEELEHFEIVRQAMVRLGADPTAETPSADVMGVASAGILQVVTDPRTTLVETFEAILVTELVDKEGWQLLVDLARQLGHDDLARAFHTALVEEERHLSFVRALLQRNLLGEARGKAPGAAAGTSPPQ